jgi:hypothetical protein
VVTDVSTDPAIPPTSLAGSNDLVGLNRVLFDVCRLSRWISISRIYGWDASELGIHFYVLFWLGGLTLILAVGPTVGWPGWIMVGIAFYRLQDLIFSTLANALSLSSHVRSRSYSMRTLVVLALVNIVQIVLIFAIAYLVLTAQHPASFAQPPSGRFGYFFLGWVSLPPLGGGATPLSTMARALTIGEEATGLLIVVIAVSRFLSAPN